MFNQFPEILGVRKTNYMTGLKNGLANAIETGANLARRKTARVRIRSLRMTRKELTANVQVVNLAGHRLPSGVGFRRAFLEFKVTDPKGKVLWASGRTDQNGIIVDAEGKALPCESFRRDRRVPRKSRVDFCPHMEVIDKEHQVQIYQELIKSPERKFTTSFLSLKKIVKDNRLLPKGWTRKGPPGFQYADKTHAEGRAAADRNFGAGSDRITYIVPRSRLRGQGKIRVTATLYYQAIPPFYLKTRPTFGAARFWSGLRAPVSSCRCVFPLG